jgi:hypothetical protein
VPACASVHVCLCACVPKLARGGVRVCLCARVTLRACADIGEGGHQGVVLTLVDDSDADWVEVAVPNGAQRGFVPRTYVEECEEGTSAAFSEWDEPEHVSVRASSQQRRTVFRSTIYTQRLDTLTHALDDDGYASPTREAEAELGWPAPTPTTTTTEEDTASAGPAAGRGGGPLIVRLLYDYEARGRARKGHRSTRTLTCVTLLCPCVLVPMRLMCMGQCLLLPMRIKPPVAVHMNPCVLVPMRLMCMGLCVLLPMRIHASVAVHIMNLCVLLRASQARNEEELSAQEGEFLQVLDSSDPDWYHVKPIARLAESGYVPVSYCEAQDLSKMEPGTDARAGDERRGGLPVCKCVCTEASTYMCVHLGVPLR